MATRKLLIFTVLFAICAIVLSAQTTEVNLAGETDILEMEEEELFYFLDRTDDGWRFIQRLMWDGAEYVTRYVVIIEKLEEGIYNETERVGTQETFVEVSLNAGEYRYCIEVYDIFDELALTTNWQEFQVIRALQPEISGFTPAGFFLDETDSWVITLRGRNLLPDSVIYLVRNNARIVPVSFSVERNSARLVFSEVSLVPGEYGIYVKNPGGLETSRGVFTIGYRKPFDLNVSLVYAPVIPLSGFLFKDAELEAPFPDSFYPFSGGAKISFIPFKRPWGYMGAELNGSLSYLKSEKDFFTSKGLFLNSHISLLYQNYFMNRTFVFNAGIGAGITTLLNFVYEYPVGPATESFNGIYPSFTLSLSFSWFFVKPFYVNAGADVIQMITANEDGRMPIFIRPALSVGIQL